MSERSEIPSSQMAVINGIDSKVDIVDGNIDTILSNYVTKTDLQSALANIGGGEEVTVKFTNGATDPYVVISSGTKTVGTFYENDTFTIPYGVKWTATPHDGNVTYK